MPDLPKIGSLWIGGDLSWLEQLCLKSFADAGHDVTLYSYGEIGNLPGGVALADAAEVLAVPSILTHERTGSPAIHADVWRLHMVQKTGRIWVDADMYCWKPFDFAAPHVFGLEKPGVVCNAVLGLPQDSPALGALIDRFDRALATGDGGASLGREKWGATGPGALTEALAATGEIALAQPEAVFFPVPFRERNHMIKPRLDIRARLSEGTRGIHFWARRMKPRLAEQEGNRPRPGSFLDGLVRRHGIDPDAAPIRGRTLSHTRSLPRPAYSEVIETGGLRLPFVPEVITPKIERPLRRGRYEGGEIELLRRALQPDDRVLDLGAGLGLVAAAAAKIVGDRSVTTVEANPGLLPVIAETLRLNDVSGVRLLHGIAVGTESPEARTATFYLRPDFWASSMEPHSRAFSATAEVPVLSLARLVADERPTVLTCDIEGGELGLFDDVDLTGIRHVVIETHPKVYGEDGLRRVDEALRRQGFEIAEDSPEGSSVRAYRRPVRAAAPRAAGPALADIAGAWPPAGARAVVVSCMKDEGPFILEWIAWHRAAGVDRFVIFTNDCSDGTDALLDRLADMGIVRHAENPAVGMGSTYFQPVALKHFMTMPEFAEADFVISMDVDEFLNIHVGEGRLQDLYAAAGPFDALSVSELNHGANHRLGFEPGWVVDQFPRHQTREPGPRRAHRGVKTITRRGPALAAIRNHRPDFHRDGATVVWRDGSGRETAAFLEDPSRNGVDCRGGYDLVTLDHYALRSLASFLAKMRRGDVVIAGKSVGTRYWQERNRNGKRTAGPPPVYGRARSEYDRLMEDEALRALHAAACDAHAARIAEIWEEEPYRSRREWILGNAW
jgi:FkbM family methyltransferase